MIARAVPDRAPRPGRAKPGPVGDVVSGGGGAQPAARSVSLCCRKDPEPGGGLLLASRVETEKRRPEWGRGATPGCISYSAFSHYH